MNATGAVNRGGAGNALAVCVIGLIVLTTFARLPELFPALAPFQIGKTAVGLGLLLALAVNSGRLYSLFTVSPLGLPLLLLIGVAVLSLPFSVWRGGAMGSLMNYGKTLCAFVVLIALAENGRQGAMRFFIVLSVGLLAALLLLDTGTGRLHVSKSYDPNDMALLFVTFLPVAVAEALAARGRLMRLCCWAVTAAALAGIALTQSRGGVVALAALSLHALYLAKGRRLGIAVLGLAACVIISFTAGDSIRARFAEVTADSDYNLHAETGRLEIWRDGLGLFARRPLTGVGIGQFESALGMIGSGYYKAAHNSYLQTAVELGIVGFIAYMALLWRGWGMARQVSRATRERGLPRGQALLLAFTGFAVGGFFLSQAYGAILYTLLALIAVSWLEATEEAPAAVTAEEGAGSARPDSLPGLAGKAPAFVSQPAAPRSLTAKAGAARAARQELLRRGDEAIRRGRGAL